EIRGNRSSSSGTRSTGIAVESIRVASESTPPAPSAGGMTGANVGPLAEIGFPQNHHAGLPQLRRDKSVIRRPRSQQRQRTRRSIHAVSGIDVVFDQDRNAMEQPARPLRLALLIERVGDLQRLRVEFDDRVDHRAGLVDLLNARQVLLGQRARRILTGLKGFLDFVNRDFVELELLLEICDGRRRNDSPSQSERWRSSRNQSRGHSCAKEVTTRFVFLGEGIGRHQDSSGRAMNADASSERESYAEYKRKANAGTL